MLRKLMVMGAAMSVFVGAFMLAGLEAAANMMGRKGKPYGYVKFDIAHNCKYRKNYPRPWVKGQARHWDPNGKLTTNTFYHVKGNERASLGLQPAGRSKGDARVLPNWGWSTCKNCKTVLHFYDVPTNGTRIQSMTLRPM